MQLKSSTARLGLVFVAGVIGALAAGPGIPGAPGWLDVILGALAVGFAGLGIVPPGWSLNDEKTRAFRKPGRADGVKTRPREQGAPPAHPSTRRQTSLMLGPIAAAAVSLALVFFTIGALVPADDGSTPSRSSWGLVLGDAHAQTYPPYAMPWGWGTHYAQPCDDQVHGSASAVVYAYGGAYLHDYFRNNFGFSGTALEDQRSHCLNGATMWNVVWIADVYARAACRFIGNTVNYGVSSQIVADTGWGTNGSGCSWY